MKSGMIPVNDLGRQSAEVREAVRSAVEGVLDSGWFVLGPQLEAFEAEFAAYAGAGHCIGVGNGTDALEIALRALEIGPGDQVATVANAGGYSTTAILAAGAEPLYVDVEHASMTMDSRALAASLGPRTRAVIATHLYGQMADMPSILRAAGSAPVIEDCAQAHGARLNGRAAGAWGVLGCFSFYPTKNLGALGDAGAVTTADGELAERVRSLRQYGWRSKYRSVIRRGRNSRLDEIQAAVLRVKLPRLDEWNGRRREIARLYDERLAGSDLCLPAVHSDSYVAHLYVLRSRARDALRDALRAAGCGSDVHYPIPDHRQEAMAGEEWKVGSLPVSEQCCAEALTLPCFPELHDQEVLRVIDALQFRRAEVDREEKR
jgi:aminotransferase EvaB